MNWIALAAGTLVVVTQTQPAQEVRFTLDTVRVAVASRAAPSLAAAARTVEVIDRQTIATTAVRTVSELLARAVGADVLTRSPASSDIAIRGSSFEQVVVMVDGVSVSDDQTGHFDLDLAVDLESVERVEILRGSGSALHGPDAVGGVINIVTARAASAGRLRVEKGSFGTTSVDVADGVQLGGATLRGGAGWSESDGHRAGTDYRTRIARAAIEVPAGAGRLTADVGYGARDFGAADFYGPFESYEETRALTASLGWSQLSASRFRIAPRLTFRRHHDHFILRRTDPAFYENLHTNWRLGGELVGHWEMSPSLDLAAGSSADRMSLRSARLGDLDETRAAGFLELVADGGTSSLAAGMRADWHSAYGSFLSPSLAAMLQPSPAVRVRASFDRGFRAPTWTERFYEDPANIGNPDLGTERFWSAELGVTVADTRGASLDVVAFLRSANRLIDWVMPADAPAGTPWRTTNVEDARFRGLELKAVLADVLAADWTLRATALSFTDDEAADLESKYALRPLTRTASIEAAFDLPRGFALWARVAHARRAASHAPGPAWQHEPWTLGDVRLSWKRGAATIFVDATNVTDTAYLDVSVLPAAGRAVHVGVRIE